LDYDTEVQRMTEEQELLLKGILQSGSPFQRSASPDQGRPKGEPTGNKEAVNDEEVIKRKLKVTSPSQAGTDPKDLDIDLNLILPLLNKLSDSSLQELTGVKAPEEEKSSDTSLDNLPNILKKPLKDILE
jgi:hypothetical protein